MRTPLVTSEIKNRCSRCLYENDHPFGMTFSSGVCAGCLTHEEKDQLHWSNREALFKEKIVSYLKNGYKRPYDCVLPVSGDAEDYYVVSKVLELNLRPLVVSVNDYFMNDIGWHNLHQLITYFDLDSIVYNPEIETYKELVRTTLRKMDHILWPSISLRTSFPVHIAKQKRIPLVIWGPNQALEQVGKYSHKDEVEMSKWSRKEHDLFGFDVDRVIGSGAQVSTRNLNYYRYPAVKELGDRKLRGVYLSNYFRWDPLFQNHKALQQGFIAQAQNASFDVYERAGSSVYYAIHDLLKQKRCGYRKIRDQLSREIRHGRVSRDQALKLEGHYASTPVNINGFFDWLGVTKSGIEWFIDKRLQGVEHLVSDSSNKREEKCQPDIIPETIYELTRESSSAQLDYIPFGKGVSL